MTTLGDLGVKLHGLATWWDVLEAARDTGRLDAGETAKIRAFLDDPEGWSNARGGSLRE